MQLWIHCSILQVARVCEQALAARSAIQPERDAFPVLWEVVSGLPRELNSLVHGLPIRYLRAVR